MSAKRFGGFEQLGHAYAFMTSIRSATKADDLVMDTLAIPLTDPANKLFDVDTLLFRRSLTVWNIQKNSKRALTKRSEGKVRL